MAKALRVDFPEYKDSNGVLAVYQSGKEVPFAIQRVFTVTAKNGDTRGDHAHKQCSQLLVCVSGRIRVTCDNGLEKTQFLLDGLSDGLLVPPRIWAKEEYLNDDAVLMVLCDRDYEDDDYIRVYSDFIKLLGHKESE